MVINPTHLNDPERFELCDEQTANDTAVATVSFAELLQAGEPLTWEEFFGKGKLT